MAQPLFRTLLCVMILAGFLGDYFIYHKTGDRLKGFRDAVRALQDLKVGKAGIEFKPPLL